MTIPTPSRADAAVGLPLTPRLTPEWLTALLRSRGRLAQARVIQVDESPIGNGMMAATLRLALRYGRDEPGAPATLIAKLPWITRDADVELHQNAYEQSWAMTVDRYRDRLDAAVLGVIEAFASRIRAYYRQQPRPWTITHQDYRLDNMLFDAPGGVPRLTVVDWRTVRIGPGISDVAYFIGACMAPELRRDCEHQLLQRDVDGLGARGLNKGPLAVGYDCFPTASISSFAPPWAHVQSFVTATLHRPDGSTRQGAGVLEPLMLGPYAPLGLSQALDPIP